jgi:hypothetical protein
MTANGIADHFGIKLLAVNRGKVGFADATFQRKIAHLMIADL